MSNQVTIPLLEGGSIEIHKLEWPVLVSASQGRLVDGTCQRLQVATHQDGRRLVYADLCVQRYSAPTMKGTVLDGGSDVADALRQVAQSLDLARWLVEKCIEELSRQSK